MKKAVSLILVALIIMSCFAMGVSAAECYPNGHHRYVFDYKVESTCSTNGYDMEICSLCGDTRKAPGSWYAKLPHNYEYSYYEGREDWCHVKERKCKDCGDCKTVYWNQENGDKHIDKNGDKVCDFCHRDFSSCNHMCHKGGAFWNFIRFFLSIFGASKNCKCGFPHY